MIVKVCGMRDAENIRAVETLAMPDWMGFIFYPRSPRYVAEVPTHLPMCRRIGVFVQPDEGEVLHLADAFGLWGVQLYDASPELCQSLRDSGLHVIVALSAKGDLDNLARPYLTACDYFLFDTPTKGYGGSGRCFDHTLLQTYTGNVPFLLSGGLGPHSLQMVRDVQHPMCCGVDLNSGFETSPAVKDAQSLQKFVSDLRQTIKHA